VGGIDESKEKAQIRKQSLPPALSVYLPKYATLGHFLAE
jgi:hypothetical protein